MNTDTIDPDFDDRDSGDWEELFSLPEPDEAELERLQDHHGCRESGMEMWDFPSAQHRGEEATSCDDYIVLDLPDDSVAWAAKTAPSRAQVYSGRNEFGDPIECQLRGILGEVAFAIWFFGNWAKACDVAPLKADFEGIDVKASRHPGGIDLGRLHLIEAESFAGHIPTQHELYVQVFVDIEARKAVLVGWCRGHELFDREPTPIPKRPHCLGYQVRVSALHPMVRFPRPRKV